MSTVTSCTLLSGRPAAAQVSSSGGRLLHSGMALAVALPCFQSKSRPLSVCFATNPNGEHGSETNLPPFKISPVALVHPGSPSEERWRSERWQIKEEAHAVNMLFQVPGLYKHDLDVELDEDVLVIRKKPKAGQQLDSDADGSGVYARLLVPAGYSRERVKAKIASGVLTVTIDKVKKHARRRINVDID